MAELPLPPNDLPKPPRTFSTRFVIVAVLLTAVVTSGLWYAGSLLYANSWNERAHSRLVSMSTDALQPLCGTPLYFSDAPEGALVPDMVVYGSCESTASLKSAQDVLGPNGWQVLDTSEGATGDGTWTLDALQGVTRMRLTFTGDTMETAVGSLT